MEDYIYYRKISKEELKRVLKSASEGNIPAILTLILHNQNTLNSKLNKLLKK